ncbi:hypothetical protein CEXT_401581 [Caerostris extrusa]|uniref:Uncharacterized protein n=1 Tax=Caerostris extrusa TaxID=172846 RepID=A0AAV4U9V6_CAEEX|nr:hypothetical protein CEXT_401581 [Caerostris extrusa]
MKRSCRNAFNKWLNDLPESSLPDPYIMQIVLSPHFPGPRDIEKSNFLSVHSNGESPGVNANPLNRKYPLATLWRELTIATAAHCLNEILP